MPASHKDYTWNTTKNVRISLLAAFENRVQDNPMPLYFDKFDNFE